MEHVIAAMKRAYSKANQDSIVLNSQLIDLQERLIDLKAQTERVEAEIATNSATAYELRRWLESNGAV